MLTAYARDTDENITDLNEELNRRVEIPGTMYELSVGLPHIETTEAERAAALNLKTLILEGLSGNDREFRLHPGIFKDLHSEDSPWPTIEDTDILFKVGNGMDFGFIQDPEVRQKTEQDFKGRIYLENNGKTLIGVSRGENDSSYQYVHPKSELTGGMHAQGDNAVMVELDSNDARVMFLHFYKK